MESKHTPGPWVISKNAPDYKGRCTVRDSNGWEIAQIPGLSLDFDQPRQDANARLIAAAPDMLEALESLDATLGHADDCTYRHHGECNCHRSMISAAIAKAQGK